MSSSSTIAAELENQIIQDRKFEGGDPQFDGKSILDTDYSESVINSASDVDSVLPDKINQQYNVKSC